MAELNVRQVNFTARAVLALSIGYGAFISEILRAGIESIEKEQSEAAQTEGANYWQIMRHILLPQAVRNVLPALGNEFIAMLKDSALVSVLGVQDITQLGKVYVQVGLLHHDSIQLSNFHRWCISEHSGLPKDTKQITWGL